MLTETLKETGQYRILREFRRPFLIFAMLFSYCSVAGEDSTIAGASIRQKKIKRINLIISSRAGKIDPGTISFQVQAFIQRSILMKEIHLVVAGSSKELYHKIKKIAEREHALIGNIWFDSHGHYGKRYSLFEIGEEEFNWMNIANEKKVFWLKKISVFCDSNTKAGIGACYSGATYNTPAIAEFPPCPMGGDSLMVRLSRLLNNAEVYGSESWVMTKPGLFARKYGLSGYPTKKRFRDVFLRPAWERVGRWNVYRGASAEFTSVQGVYLTGVGEIMEIDKSYLDFSENRRKVTKKIRRLKKGNFNLAYLRQ